MRKLSLFLCLALLLSLTACGTGSASKQPTGGAAGSEPSEDTAFAPSDFGETCAPADTATVSASASEGSSEGSSQAAKPDFNVKVTADTLMVRRDPSAEGKAIGSLEKGVVKRPLSVKRDAQGRDWFEIDYAFGVTGYIAGWYCEQTEEQDRNPVKSEPGQMLPECPDGPLFVDVILSEDTSLEGLLKKYGDGYTVRTVDEGITTYYEYQNGVRIDVSDGKVTGLCISNYGLELVSKEICNIFPNTGDEQLTVYKHGCYYRLLVTDAETGAILRNYALTYWNDLDFQTGDFDADGKTELYLSGDEYGPKTQGIYRAVGDDFVQVYVPSSFASICAGIHPAITGNRLSLNYKIGDFSGSAQSVLPDRAFYSTADTADKNKLLSVDPEFYPTQKEGRWFISLRCSVNLIVLEYYWGPPGGGTEFNELLKNDLVRFDVLLELIKDKPVVAQVEYTLKYDDPSLNVAEPMLYEEGALKNGPALGMALEDACLSLGGEPKELKCDQFEYKKDGVFVQVGFVSVENIVVASGDYATLRGLKIGDTIETVEQLYGKPDVGFSGDESVEYKFCYKDEDTGSLQLNFYRTLTIHYTDGRVSAYEMEQYILD